MSTVSTGGRGSPRRSRSETWPCRAANLAVVRNSEVPHSSRARIPISSPPASPPRAACFLLGDRALRFSKTFPAKSQLELRGSSHTGTRNGDARSSRGQKRQRDVAAAQGRACREGGERAADIESPQRAEPGERSIPGLCRGLLCPTSSAIGSRHQPRPPNFSPS